MPKNLLSLDKDNPFDISEPTSEKTSSNGGSRFRQRERIYVTDLRKAGEEWEKINPAEVYSGKDHALTEEQVLTTPPYVAAFNIARKAMGQWCPLEVMYDLVC